MNGLIGLNTRTIGVSRDEIMRAATQIGSAWILCQNDPDLVREANAAGFKTIYRQSGDEALDMDAAAFIRERAKKGATLAHSYNEITSQPKLHSNTKASLETGIPQVIYNYGTHAPKQFYIDSFDNIQYAVTHNCAMGIHFYPDAEHDSTLKEFLDIKRQVGGLWIVTEFGYLRDYKNPYKGWRGKKNPTERAKFLDEWMPFFNAENTPVCTFCFDPWDQPTVEDAKADGLGFWDYSDVIEKMANLNKQFTWSEKPVTPTQPSIAKPANPGVGVPSTVLETDIRLRTSPNLDAPILRALRINEQVMVYEGGKVDVSGYPFRYLTDMAGKALGWAAIASKTGEVWIKANSATDTGRVVIADMPYADEFKWRTGWTALCGETSLYMCLLYDRQWRHVPFPQEITPYTIALYLGKGAKDFTNLNELHNASIAYGIKMHGDTGLWTDPLALLTTEIDQKHPIITLLDYSKLPTRQDQSFGGGHILVVVGYSDQSVICHDPDSVGVNGKYTSYPRADFLAAWKAMGCQALVLG